jgi:RHS repeat-associated protein
MATASNAGSTATYTYNALGQRIKRATSGVSTMYMYDEAGHLAGEYTTTGILIQETVWLGDTPVATLRPNEAGGVNLFYVHADHLNTPRLVTDTSNNIRWSWDSDAFGTTVPNENPAGVGMFEYNLRFPGQQYDAVVGLHYNYFRDYDPHTGLYVASDPIGLDGGMNTYLYAGGAPTIAYDSEGAAATTAPGIRIPGIRIPPPNPVVVAGAVGLGIGTIVYPSISQPLGDLIDRMCPPDCNPPKGTVCFIIDRVPPSKPHRPITGSHYHLWQMNQTPTGMCHWNKLEPKASRTAPPGAIPCPFTRPKR